MGQRCRPSSALVFPLEGEYPTFLQNVPHSGPPSSADFMSSFTSGELAVKATTARTAEPVGGPEFSVPTPVALPGAGGTLPTWSPGHTCWVTALVGG